MKEFSEKFVTCYLYWTVSRYFHIKEQCKAALAKNESWLFLVVVGVSE